MSLEERTLVVRHLDDRVTRELLFELFNQAGPVVNVVLRPDFAFVEFEHKVSVGYALALLDGIHLFGSELVLEPKLRSEASYYTFKNDIDYFNHVMASKPDYFLQFMPNRGEDMSSMRQQERRRDQRREDRFSSHSRRRHSNGFRNFY